MGGLEVLFNQFAGLFVDPGALAILFFSTVLGVIIGALPGLSATMGIALLTGITYQFPIVYTFAILMGVYVGAIYGGSISAILLNIPGTGSAAATALDGHPLALQGKADTAIMVTRAASIIGTFIGVLALALIAPLMTKVALMFRSPEYFMLAFFGVLICGSVVNSDIPIKGWIGGILGLMVAMIGVDRIMGASRFDLGITELMGGISVVPAMIGFYGIPEVIKAFANNSKSEVVGEETKKKLTRDQRKALAKEEIAKAKQYKKDHPEETVSKIVFSKIRLIVQSALIGLGVGSLPGVGEDVAAWVSYDTAKRTSKEPEKFGHGSYEGCIAPEVANNSAIGGAMIPMLTLAVPGSPPAAVLLGAMMIHNVRPGPMIMRDNPEFIPYISALLFLAVLTLWIAGTIMAKPMTKILKIPKTYLMPIVAALCIIGSYAIANRPFDIVLALWFGIIGYFLDKMQYSPAPLVLGIILGPMIDENFRRSLMVSHGNASIFFNPIDHPIALGFFIVIVIMIVHQSRKSAKERAIARAARNKAKQK